MTNTSQQSTVNLQPSTINRQPSTVNRQPSTNLNFRFQRLEKLSIYPRLPRQGNFPSTSNFLNPKFIQNLDDRHHFTRISHYFQCQRIITNIHHSRSKNLR